MTAIEEMLETIPTNIVKTLDVQCFSCGSTHKKQIRYELKIEVFNHETRPNRIKKRYKMYYETKSFGAGDNLRYIGNPGGLGFSTLKEAFEELKGYLEYAD